jgi:HK97 family phage portal protein
MKSILLDRILKATPLGARGDYGWGMTGAYGERYEPESRQEFVDAYFDRVWTHRCVELIATSMTQVRMQVRVGDDWTDEHRLIDLLQRPNPRDPAQMFFEWTARWAEILGEWQWEVVPARDGGIAQLFPLRSHLVRIKPDDRGRVAGYVYDPHENGTDTITYEAVDPDKPTRVKGRGDTPIVVAGRYANPKDDYYGMGPLRAAKDDIISEYYGVRYDHRFFRNSGRPDIVVGFKGKMDDDQRKANKEEWQQFKGVDNAHRAAVMDGEPDITKLSETQKDVEYLEGRRLSREGQCAAFGIPPVLVGDMTRATYSNFENAEPIFWKITMLPKLSFFATWTNYVLLPFFPDIEEFGFDVSEIPALARAEGWRSERIVGEVAGGVRTPAEGRDALGLEPVDEPAAERLYLPTKLRPIGEAAEPAPPPPGPAPPPPAEADPAGEKSLRVLMARREKTTVATWLRNALEAKRRFSDRGVTEIAKHFGEQRDRVLAIIEGQEKSAELERLLREYGWSDDSAKFHAVVEAMQAGLADVAFSLTEPTLDHTPSPGLLERVIRSVADRPDGIQSVSGRVKSEVLDQVRLGIEHGLTYRQIAEGGTYASATADVGDVTLKGVQGVYEEYTTWQAERIARTEAGHTFNVASAAVMRDAGVTHVDITDGDEDGPCGEWNGTRKTIEEYESEPLGHPNCTRIGLPVIEVATP